jgi:hypothetical protein
VTDDETDQSQVDPDDWTANVRSRGVYELACRLRDVGKFSTAGGSRERLHWVAGGARDAILAEVIRQKGDGDEIRDDVADACEGRRPRW